MANFQERYSNNAEGQFFVDRTCINCDACRQLAPSTFGEINGHSFVTSQPKTDEEERAATRALLSCPVGCIGTVGPNKAKETMKDLPLKLAESVYYCGFNSPKSYGGNSYFIVHPDGNWLIDSPKFLPHLVQRFNEMGGIKYIFLTHRDDVADAFKYAEKFNAKRIIHEEEADSAPGAEIVLSIDADQAVNSSLHSAFTTDLSDQFKVIFTPGHTRGHICLLYDNQFLFSGDHIAFDRESQELESFRDYCWYSWQEQIKSIAKLRELKFSCIYPGHGQSICTSETDMQQKLTTLVESIKSQS